MRYALCYFLNEKGGNGLNRDEALGGIVIFLFGAVTTLLSLKMPIGTFRMAGTGMFPLCLGILLMILSGIFVLKLLLQERKIPAKEESVKISGLKRPMILFLATIALATLLFNQLGYPLISFLLMLGLLRILGMKRWSVVLPLSLVTAVISYFLFVQWLQIPLPKGWIGL
jgi:hypothetical protein